eukprot:1888172-Pleurochrysis_carterae.AAC.1
MPARAPLRRPGLAVSRAEFASVLLLFVVRCGAFVFDTLFRSGDLRFNFKCVTAAAVVEQTAVSVAVESGVEIARNGAGGQQTNVEHRARVVVESSNRVRKFFGEHRVTDALRGWERPIDLVELVMKFIEGRYRGLGDAALMNLIEHQFEGGTGGG